MHEFHLPDMTCGHCASTVNRTLKLIDPACGIQVDLPRLMVHVKTGEDRQTLVDALTDAGHAPL
jgi:copper chaperone